MSAVLEKPRKRDLRPIEEYLLLGGTHVQDSPDKVWDGGPDGNHPLKGKPVEEHFQYSQGEPPPLVRSREDLAAKFPGKFARANAFRSQAPAAVVEVSADSERLLAMLDAKQLRTYAEAEEIDVGAIKADDPRAKEKLAQAIKDGLRARKQGK